MPSTVPLEMPSSKAPASILIIDDIPQIHNFLAMHLRSEQYSIHRAVTGMEGLEIVQTHHIDLVLLDIGLPDISGFEVLKQLKGDPRYAAIPVVILTIRDLTENIVRALELGAYDYVTKPFEPAELRARVKSAIAMKFFQEKLEQSRKQFVTMVNSLAEVVFQLTIDGEINFINSTWEDMSGYSVKNSLLVSLFDFLHPDDTDAVRAHIGRLAAGALPSVKFEARFLTAGEQVFWGEIKLRPVLDEHERVSGFAGTIIDITQRKKAQEELELRKEHFRLLIENSDDVIFTINEIGIIQYVSPSIVHVLGCTSSETEERSLLSLVHPDDRFTAKSALAEAVTSSGTAEPVELRLTCSNGRYRECEVVMNNLLHSPPVGGIVVTLRNIGERNTARRELSVRDSVLQGLHEAFTALRSPAEENGGLPVALAALGNAVGADVLQIALLSGDDHQLVPVSGWAQQEEPRTDVEALSGLPSVYWLDALKHRQAVVLDRHTPHDEVISWLEQADIASLLLLPIVRNGYTIGLLGVARTESGEWLPAERTALEIAACALTGLLNGMPDIESRIREFLRRSGVAV